MDYKKPLKITAIIIGVYLLLNIGYYAVKFGQEMYNQSKTLSQVESTLGISHGSPYIDGVEVIELHVQPGSIAADAGLMDGDILLNRTSGAFAKDIYDSRGKAFQFKVKRNGQDVLITIPTVPTFND